MAVHEYPHGNVEIRARLSLVLFTESGPQAEVVGEVEDLLWYYTGLKGITSHKANLRVCSILQDEWNKARLKL